MAPRTNRRKSPKVKTDKRCKNSNSPIPIQGEKLAKSDKKHEK